MLIQITVSFLFWCQFPTLFSTLLFKLSGLEWLLSHCLAHSLIKVLSLLIRPYFVLVCLQSILHPLKAILLIIKLWEHWFICLSSYLSECYSVYWVIPLIHIHKYFTHSQSLSYQASLTYNLGEFLGVITNWRRCRGEEIEAQLPWDMT